MDSKKIGERLRQLRGGRTQKEVAEAVGVTPMAISQYENGERMPRDEVKIALAKYYRRTVHNIFFSDK